MLNQQLLDFIKLQIQKGLDRETISKELLANGWNLQDIEEGFNAINGGIQPSTLIPKPPIISSTPTTFLKEKSHSGRNIFLLVLVIFLLAGGALGYYFKNDLINLPVIKDFFPVKEIALVKTEPLTPTIPTPTIPTSVSLNTNCSDYDCLISAAKQCQPVSGIISYSGVPNPLSDTFLMSGQNKYEIIKSPSVSNNCTFVYSSLTSTFNVSDKGHKTLLAQGMTETQITSQLKTMNESLKSIIGLKNTCVSNAGTIAAYITDAKNGNLDSSTSGSTTTYTISSGQKLICTAEQPTGKVTPN